MSTDSSAEPLHDPATTARLIARAPLAWLRATGSLRLSSVICLLGTVPALLLAAALLSGCAGRGDGTTADGRPVAVTDARTIAGRWAGLFDLSGHRQPDFVEMTITPDGTYNVKGFRTVGVLDAQGRVEAADGTLRFRGPRATATGRLYEQGAGRTLVIDAQGEAGNTATLRLTPIR